MRVVRCGVVCVCMALSTLSGSVKADDDVLFVEAKSRGYLKDARVVEGMRQAAAQAVLRHETQSLEKYVFSRADKERYFKEHRDAWEQPEYRRVSHILLKSRADAERIWAEASKLDAHAFAKLARAHSVDTETKLRGGDLRYFDIKGRPPGKGPWVDASIAKAAFKIAQIATVAPQPVAVGDMWSIIQLTGVRPPVVQSIEALDDWLIQNLRLERRLDMEKRLISRLLQAHRPKVSEDVWKRVSQPKLDVDVLRTVQAGDY